jgi:hypothetical protein
LKCYSVCSHWIAADLATTLEVAFQNSHGYRDNSVAIRPPVVAHAAGGGDSQIPDNQTTHTAPFDTVAHINSISQVVLRIPQFLLFTGVYRKIGLAARYQSPLPAITAHHRVGHPACKCASAAPAACA